jgi:hypothetical protein
MHDAKLARLAPITARQAGAFHVRQAANIGIDRRTITAAMRAGVLVRLHANVFSFAGIPPTDLRRVWAAVLQVGDGTVGDHAVGSHEATFRARGVAHVPHEAVVSVRPGSNQRHNGIRVHRFGDLHPDMVEYVDGLPLTTIARGIVDLTSVFRRARLDQLLDHVTITERSTTLGAVDRALRRSNRRGRRNIRMLQELLDARDEHAPRSLSEQLADDLLAGTDLPAPQREYPHPGWELGPAFVDRAWPDVMLIVEIDGRSWHERERDMQKDRERDRAAGLVGWYTARFIHREVRDEPDVFVSDVVGLYRQRLIQLGRPASSSPNLGHFDD